MRLLHDMINQRAEETYTGPPLGSAKTNDFIGIDGYYRHWVTHWFTTAEALRDEMKAEGLLNTAQEIQDWIDVNYTYSDRYWNDNYVPFNADRKLGQNQYASRYIDGRHGSPNLGKGLRFYGDPTDYHDVKIHKEDYDKFRSRVLDHLAKTRGIG